MTDLSHSPPTPPAASPPPVEPPASPKSANGWAITALITGIVAFLVGLVPVLGILLGLAGVSFGVVALVKKQPKGLAVTGLVLASLATLASIGVTAGIASISDTATSEPIAESTPSPVEEPEPEPTEAPEPEPAEEPAAKEKEEPAPEEAAQASVGYQSIYDTYAAKLKAECPTLAMTECAELSNEGITKMAEYMYTASGTDGQYQTYEMWAGKLMDVYLAEAR